MSRSSFGSLRASLDLHLSLGKQDDADRYEDATGSHHAPSRVTGFVRYVHPEEEDR